MGSLYVVSALTKEHESDHDNKHGKGHDTEHKKAHGKQDMTQEEKEAYEKLKHKFNVVPKKHSVKEMSRLSEVFTVLRQPGSIKVFAISVIGLAVLYSFFYGLFTIPFLEIGFFKMQPFGLWDAVYVITAVVLSGLVITLLRHSRKTKGGKGMFAGGLVGAGFGVVCPVCLGVNILILGNVVALPLAFLIPYLWIIQAASLLLLFTALWIVSRNVSCDSCFVKTEKIIHAKKDELFGDITKPLHRYSLYVMALLAVVLLVYQIVPVLAFSPAVGVQVNGNADVNEIVSQVLPEEGFTLEARWGDVVKKMVDEGVLDPDKLESILKNRYGQEMKPEWRRILAGEDAKLSIDAENSVFMMYLTWTLAKHNDVPLIHDSRFSSYFQNYDIGVGRAGYGDVALLSLTEEQLRAADRVAQNSYRPCCGQSAANPDCSHGFAALGLIELMASQGYTEDEMFDAFVKFNSFWFPSTYIQNAMYFKVTENQDWEDVDKETIAGQQFSSLSGSYAVKKYLQEQGF